jgi:hypothetical protein
MRLLKKPGSGSASYEMNFMLTFYNIKLFLKGIINADEAGA